MSKKRSLPFSLVPSHWGLKGKLREVALAEYNLEGEELERELLRINLAERTEDEMARVDLQISRKYNHITEEEYERKLLDLSKKNLTDKEYKLRCLDLDKKYGVISGDEYDKQTAEVQEEPYVRVAKVYTDPANPAFGSIILDWNKAFVRHLEENGYGPAPTDEEIVDQWFSELCKNIALDAFDGIGDFNEKLDEAQTRNPDIIYKKDLKAKKED